MVGTDDGEKNWFVSGNEKNDDPRFKLWRRNDEQLTCGDELDDTLMAGLVRILVNAMMECGGSGE